MNPFIVGIRFQKIGKLYHFDASHFRDLIPGDFVIVETSRGKQLGEVIQTYADTPPQPPDGSWKSVERRASARDLVLRQMWGRKELEATINCRAKMSEMGVRGVKIIASEFSFDGSRLAFLYSSESGDRQELGKLRGVMQRTYSRTKVEMRQIGPRDVAKILGGMGACGLETRCCSMFLTEFSPVSIKMAKEQGISLTPSEITGMCGRLRCCLVYEYEQYVEARKTLPKRGKKVVTPLGEGKVIDTYPLRQSVIVVLGDGNRHEFMKFELEPWDELEALRRKAEGPCDRHENGECDCGKSSAEAKAQAQDKTIEIDSAQAESLNRELDELIGRTDEAEPHQDKGRGSSRKSSAKKGSQPQQSSSAAQTEATQGEGGSGAKTGSEQPRKKRSRRPFRKKRSRSGKSGSSGSQNSSKNQSSGGNSGGSQAGNSSNQSRDK
jgi:cell fate regulator YaaT (PSP1 superfamily)